MTCAGGRAIPKSFIFSRLLHNKLPNDDNLIIRGCYMTSCCEICGALNGSTFHSFVDCSLTKIYGIS